MTRAYMSGFDEIFLRLRSYPLIGRLCPEFGRGVRRCLQAPYHLFYRYESSVISIQRVLHTARRHQPLCKGKP